MAATLGAPDTIKDHRGCNKLNEVIVQRAQQQQAERYLGRAALPARVPKLPLGA